MGGMERRGDELMGDVGGVEGRSNKSKRKKKKKLLQHSCDDVRPPRRSRSKTMAS